MRAAFGKIGFQRFDGRAAQRNDALLVAFAAHLHPAQVERQVAGVQRGDLGDAQAAGIQKLQNGVIAQRGCPGLGMMGGHRGALQHLVHFRLGQRLGQHLPRFGRLDVDGGIVMNAAVQQQPLVKAAQAAQLARRGTRIDAVGAQVFEEARHILLHGRQQHPVPGFQKLGKGPQVAQVGFAGERPQAFLHAQIRLVILQERQVGGRVH